MKMWRTNGDRLVVIFAFRFFQRRHSRDLHSVISQSLVVQGGEVALDSEVGRGVGYL